MTRYFASVDRDPDVQKIARTLGVDGPDLKDRLCLAAVERLARRMEMLAIEPQTLDDVHLVVLNMTGVRIERLESDEDLGRVSDKYKTKQALVGVQLELEFGPSTGTEALVFRDDAQDLRTPRFTAVVDARGDRAYRAWFAERHETAHLLVPDPSGKVAWRRTKANRPEPVEQLIDAVASQVGFWEPIVKPRLLAALRSSQTVLDAFDRVREELAPRASREACYRAFARLVEFPLTLLRAQMAPRRADPQNAASSLALRATTVIWNDAADRAGIIVWDNFRIPVHSIIGGPSERASADDDLNAWRTESGRSLVQRSLRVRVTVRRSWASIEVAA